MTIAHIVCSYPPYFGGMGNVAFEMVKQLQAQGHNVRVYTPQYLPSDEIKSPQEAQTQHSRDLQEQIEQVKRLAPRLSYGNGAYMPQVLKELDDVDIVHLHYPFFGTANLVRKWKKRHPEKSLVISYHMDTRAAGWKGLFFRYYTAFWMPKILREADAIIAASFDYIEHSAARNIYRQDPNKWHEIPFGVDTDRFFPKDTTDELYRKLEREKERDTLLFVGGMDRPHYFKGIPILLQAMKLLSRSGQAPQLILVGKGELQQEFERQAHVLGLAKDVHFLGGVSHEELPAVYQAADALVLPSIHQGEAFGMVLLEAYASALPVIASNLPGVRSVAQKGGVVVEPNNSHALAQGIIDGLALAKEAEIQEGNRLLAEQEYSWKQVGKQIEELYKNLRS